MSTGAGTNLAIRIGQAMRPESDVQATIAHAYVLRALQARDAVKARSSARVFLKAATIPLERALEDEAGLDSLANYFRDEA
jgi:hypothetical protein